MHQIPNVDHDSAWNGAGTDPCAIHLLDFEAAQVVLRIDEERNFFMYHVLVFITSWQHGKLFHTVPGREVSSRHNQCGRHIL